MNCNSLTSRFSVAAYAFGTCFCVLHFHAASLRVCSDKQTTPSTTTTTTHTHTSLPSQRLKHIIKVCHGGGMHALHCTRRICADAT